ncbi:MAG: prolyl oligopeptidase family serine peptidase [Pseudomonadota bacterium]
MTKNLLQWFIAIPAFAIAIFNVLAMTAYAKDADDTSPAKLPATPVHPVTNTYFGVAVTDPYQWLENVKDPETEKWLKAQNNHTRTLLDQIPKRKALLQRISALGDASEQVSGTQWADGFYFYTKRRPGDNNRKLYMRQGIDGKERLLVDPDRFAEGSQHAAIDYYRASWDGKYVAYGISRGGSENSILHIVEVATGRQLPDQIERTTFGSPSWRMDGRSFFYNRLQLLAANAPPTERYQRSQVYLHVIGTDSEKDMPVFGHGLAGVELAPDDVPTIQTTPDSPYVFGTVSHGTQNEITIYALPANKVDGQSPWRKLIDIPDEISEYDVRGETLYLLSHKGASRFKILRTSIAAPDLAKAEIVVPESQAVITDLRAAKDGLYVQQLDGGPSRLLRLPLNNKGEVTGPLTQIRLPFDGSISEIVTDTRTLGALVLLQSWTKSPLHYTFNPTTNALTRTRLTPPSPVDFSQIESVEVKATSADGTLIPLSIIYKRGLKRNGANPTVLTGYGAYGVTLDPTFNPMRLAWLEQGGVLAVAHVRGGGEYGEDWHKDGQKLKKQNTFSDFIACAEYLIQEKYTSPTKLAARGGSAGGITVGGAITQRPDLFGAAVSEVGVADNLRIELSANGPSNIPEFGSVKTEEGFKGLFAMSSYHHVKDGTPYPAILLTTGINDPRVDSWQPAKMAARLQAATSSGKPVLLRVDYDAGHGLGSTKSQNDQELADVYAFLLWQLGK